MDEGILGGCFELIEIVQFFCSEPTVLKVLHIPEQPFVENESQICFFLWLDEKTVDMFDHDEEEPTK